MRNLVLILATLLTVNAFADSTIVEIENPIDGVGQEMFYYAPENPSSEKVLIVGIHSWKGHVNSFERPLYLEECQKRGWYLMYTNHRGASIHHSNTDLAMADIREGMKFMVSQFGEFDKTHAVGVSGGGWMSLMMKSRYPDLFDKVEAWTPIMNYKNWHKWTIKNNQNIHRPQIETFCDNDFKNCAKYNPTKVLRKISGKGVTIWAGREDKLIPPGHIFRKRKLLKKNGFRFKRFNGGHEIFTDVAFERLESNL